MRTSHTNNAKQGAQWGRPDRLDIDTTTTRSKVSYRIAPYVVVTNPGTMFERIEEHCISRQQAIEYLDEYEQPVDVMKVTPSGYLTTEF